MLSTVWNTQRGSQSSIEKRRGRQEIEATRRRGGGVKRRETDQPVIIFLSVLHRPEHTTRFTVLGRGEKGEGGDRGDLGKNKESQKGRQQSSQ